MCFLPIDAYSLFNVLTFDFIHNAARRIALKPIYAFLLSPYFYHQWLNLYDAIVTEYLQTSALIELATKLINGRFDCEVHSMLHSRWK